MIGVSNNLGPKPRDTVNIRSQIVRGAEDAPKIVGVDEDRRGASFGSQGESSRNCVKGYILRLSNLSGYRRHKSEAKEGGKQARKKTGSHFVGDANYMARKRIEST
jgi:hypothetical protein